jgi:hypothetical protein
MSETSNQWVAEGVNPMHADRHAAMKVYAAVGAIAGAQIVWVGLLAWLVVRVAL